LKPAAARRRRRHRRPAPSRASPEALCTAILRASFLCAALHRGRRPRALPRALLPPVVVPSGVGLLPRASTSSRGVLRTPRPLHTPPRKPSAAASVPPYAAAQALRRLCAPSEPLNEFAISRAHSPYKPHSKRAPDGRFRPTPASRRRPASPPALCATARTAASRTSRPIDPRVQICPKPSQPAKCRSTLAFLQKNPSGFLKSTRRPSLLKK